MLIPQVEEDETYRNAVVKAERLSGADKRLRLPCPLCFAERGF